MDMAGEVMDDTLDDALDGADAEDETNDVVNQARPCGHTLNLLSTGCIDVDMTVCAGASWDCMEAVLVDM